MLTPSATTSRQKSENYLLRQRHTYWSYSPGGDASLETTAWCAIALRANKKVAEETWRYFQACQNSNGGWSTNNEDKESDWTSNLVTLALSAVGQQLEIDRQKQAFLNKSFNYLVDSRRRPYIEFLRWIFRLLRLPSNFPSGRGWCFYPDTCMLVEPTAYALMALKSTKSAAEEPMKKVINLAEEYLYNRYCERGGWNYGENVRLNEQLPAYVVTTAQAIIALQDKADDPRVQTGLKFVTAEAPKENTAMALAWTALARQCLGQDPSSELDLLIKHQSADGSFGKSNYLTALCLCALNCPEDNVLKFPIAPTLEVKLAKND